MNILLSRGQKGPDIARLRAALAKVMGADARQYAGLAKGSEFDAMTEAAVRHWQSGIGIVADGIVGPYCKALLDLERHAPLEIELTVPVVKRFFAGAKLSSVQRYLPYVLASLRALGLTDRAMVLAALGTIRAETDGFVPIAEFPSQYNTRPGMPPFSSYDHILGNSQPGDGYKYRGRGFVQLTGLTNYRRYGREVGIDIENFPDLANAPEVAAALLATYLLQHADAMRTALAAKNYLKARKLVNGGSHGLDRFKSVFIDAEGLSVVAARRKAAGRKKAAPAIDERCRTVVKDPADLRDRPYTPPPVSLPDSYPQPADLRKFLSNYIAAKLILDQGREGACTGFGLACVINYLRWRKIGAGTELPSVSPRMLYNYARRYDEYAGEEYEGSSCRGALKGWYHHGVCLEQDWPYQEADTCPPSFGYAQAATTNTLGVYYRIDTKMISDLQAAIQQVGAIYVSAFTHDGWGVPAVPAGKPIAHETLPVIAFDGQPSQTAGHAFALVGFNANGFIVQNSWGERWGHGGFAVLTYADWLANGMDAWVAALGVPGVMLGQLATAAQDPASAQAGASRAGWWDEARAYQHSVVLGNNGRVNNYLTQDELSRSLQYQACGLPDRWFRAQQSAVKRLVVIAHGGLNDESAAIARARALGRYFIGNDCYPLFMVWKTGLGESLADIIGDRVRREPALAGGIRDAIADANDLLLESTLGRKAVKPIWSEMKENAAFASQPTRGGDLLVTALQNLASTWGDRLEIHLLGHSAGSIFLGHLLELMAARGLADRIASLHLYAPACTVQFANRHFAPHEALLKRTYLDILSDENERGDTVAAIYRKSLLYFVSNALENDARTPLLGLEKIFDPRADNVWDGSSTTAESLKKWRQAADNAGLRIGGNIQLLESRKVATSPGAAIGASHGCFDNAVDIVGRTLQRITGAPLKLPVDDLRGF